MRQRGDFHAKASEATKGAFRPLVAAALLIATLATPAAAAPAAPSFTGPAPGSYVKDSPTPVSGTASGDAVLIRITEGITILADTGVSGGYWSVAIPLSDGAHTIVATARDAGGAWGPPSSALTFTVDSVVPAAPLITVPTDGATLTFSPITVEGTSEPGARITVDVSTGGTLTATADAAGEWAATRAFTDTQHTLVARATDAAGNVSLAGAPVTFRVDLIAPAAPQIHVPGDGTFTKDTSVTITGTAEPGSSVEVYEGSTLLMTTSPTDGHWSGIVTFTPGAHAIQARAVDPAGRASPLTPQTRFTVDVVAPPAPVILTPAQNAYVPYEYAVTGTAEPLATVKLVVNVQVVATTTADAAGRWSIVRRSFSGEQLIKARAVDRAGNVGPLSGDRFFTVDASPPPAPVVHTPNGTIFLPTGVPRIEGIATDDIGVLAVSLEYYNVLGQALPHQNANCFTCPAPFVEWHTTYAPSPGIYVVKVYVIDRAGNRSLPTKLRIIRI